MPKKKAQEPPDECEMDEELAKEVAQLKAETRRIEHRRNVQKYYWLHRDEICDKAIERRARVKKEIDSLWDDDEREKILARRQQFARERQARWRQKNRTKLAAKQAAYRQGLTGIE
ncbi:hypothetical protein FISHEDRAFT_59078 [Fistulina hepatica ATCC 64428]|uniref:Uncharacterized protein n=1 Tax=Fistulina hepatica ATCC 64428 TaxID=1128425 RepID=A0A0D7AEG2_9AGAR|nr:hypothetical protein FISHEDRAFT_59078 [Fistulina hepatica ATCC 64428]